MIEGLFFAVAEAVFSYVIDQLGPAEHIKRWLKRDPAALAFQRALGRAYIAFARQYPEYAAALFDQSFLAGAGAPELAKLLTRHLHPDPAVFAQAWGISIGFDVHSRFCREATKPAADFLKWLEVELKSEPALQPIFDSRALEILPELESQLEKMTAELKRELAEIVKTAQEYEKMVIEIGGDIRDSNVVVGDHNQVTVTKVYNQYYHGAFATLSDYYISPEAVFQRVRVDEFTGREWLAAKVDDFLNDPGRKSGAFLLVGEAGVGKTSFLAHLVKERRYLHLFAEQAPGEASLPRALGSLGSQLVTRYQINPYKDRDTLTQLAAFPDFLEKLLRLAANSLTKEEKIVIVCDALDEAGTFRDGYVFGLPTVLPDQVYFILSQRPVNVHLPNITPHIERLDAQSGENLQDMEDYLRAAAKRPEIAGQLRSKGYTEEFFIRTLKEKSLGVWMYLHYIIKEIESGSRAPLELERLPTGLIGYYADFWDDWRQGRKGRGEGPRKWSEVYAPLLTTLAAAREPVSIETVIRWAGINAGFYEVERLFLEDWRAFISERKQGEETVYLPYHASFRDFLTGKVDFTKLSPSQSSLVRDLARQTKEAHRRIVQVFREHCQGNWPQLTAEEYSRLHLADHLAEAEEFRTLVQLLTEGDESIAWAEARFAKEETYAGFLNDIALVWNYAQEKNDLGLQIRCMLIENSIRSLAGKIPTTLLAELGKISKWSYARCLAVIRQMPDSSQQVEALTHFVQDFPKALFEEALSIIGELKEEYFRASALSAIIPHLPEELKQQALAAARELKNEHYRVSALSGIIPHLPEELKQQALAAVRELKEEYLRASALSAIIPHLPEELKQQALAAAREIKDEHSRARALSGIIPHLPEELKPAVIEDALSAAREIKNEHYRAYALSAIIPHLPEELKPAVIEDTLTTAREIKEEFSRARALSAIIPHLPEELKPAVIEDALAVVREIKDEHSRANALSGIIPHLPEELKQQALAAARELKEEYLRASALSEIIPHLPEELKQQALAAVRELKDEHSRASALSEIIPHLPEELKQQALAAARELKNEHYRVSALSGIIPHLPEELKPAVIEDALTTARELKNEHYRAYALSAIIPHLPEELKPAVIDDALTTARELKEEHYRARALSAIIPHLPEELKPAVIEDALAAAREIKEEHSRASALSAIIPHLPEELKQQALAAVRELKKEYLRASALSGIIPHLPEELKQQALAAVREFKDEHSRASALSRIIPHLPEELKQQALAAARELKDEHSRASALSRIIPHLPEELNQQALAAAHELKNESSRARALSAIIPHLPEELKPAVIEDALTTAREIKEESSRSEVLANVVTSVERSLKLALLQEILAMEFRESELKKTMDAWATVQFASINEPLIKFLRMTSYQDRSTGLSRLNLLLPALIHLGGKQISGEILRSVRDTARWWP